MVYVMLIAAGLWHTSWRILNVNEARKPEKDLSLLTDFFSKIHDPVMRWHSVVLWDKRSGSRGIKKSCCWAISNSDYRMPVYFGYKKLGNVVKAIEV